MADAHSVEASGGVTVAGTATAKVVYTLSMPRETDSLLAELASEIGGAKEDVIRKAIAMFDRALQAHKEGKAVGIADDPDSLAVEFVGFGDPLRAR